MNDSKFWWGFAAGLLVGVPTGFAFYVWVDWLVGRGVY